MNPAAEGEEVFRVQNFEHQMLAEHCTNGVDVFITNRRIILLDCQVAILKQLPIMKKKDPVDLVFDLYRVDMICSSLFFLLL